MAKLAAFALILCVFLTAKSSPAKSLRLELYTQTSLEPKLTFNKTVVGGLSGLHWDGTKLVALSDDRGKFGSPRFYELELKISTDPAKSVAVKVLKVRPFKGLPQDWILDPEALAPLPPGDFLVSSEGDNNHKPRAMPHVFMTSSEGIFKSDIPLPDKYLPEATGLQKKGIENNRGFESLTATPDGERFYIMNESPILADQGGDNSGFWLRLVEFKKEKTSFKVNAEYAYVLSKAGMTNAGIEVFRGVAELLYVSDAQLIVLERGVRLTKAGVALTGGLYLVDLTGAKDGAAEKNFSAGKVPPLKKEKLLDFEEVLKNQKVENFEGLTWGPALPDGRKSLLVISDNNLAKKEKTTLLVFAVKEVD